ncbi:hypothetical protein ACKEPL_01085 [Acinetobacter baumannii]|uniref:hypothetical protein n=1 Tax=Acinetobacter baumannii TaxID=470 RepID=UPI0023415E4E|nr:hypothetical protein [Acinetobacter baumannii]MDC5619094.1 hypothetical protein [Acinetobacter baumannii]MDC5633460.1 hypothetical protein [Acinetobacter baumannii]
MHQSEVGFWGGGSMYVSGVPNDVQKFFEALTKLSLKFPNDFEWPLVLNRLYKNMFDMKILIKLKRLWISVNQN